MLKKSKKCLKKKIAKKNVKKIIKKKNAKKNVKKILKKKYRRNVKINVKMLTD